MSFIQRVRSNAVSRPNQRSFNLQDWRCDAERSAQGAHCHNLRQAGEWFHAAFATVRQQLSFVTDKSLSRQHKLRALVAHANFNAMRYDETVRAFARQDVSQDAFLGQIVPRISDGHGQEHVLDEVLLSDIDGLALPLRVLLAQREDAVAAGSAGQPVDFERLRRDYQLGTCYQVLEYHWQDCLWNDYHIRLDDTATFSPSDEAIVRWRVIGQFRRDVLQQAMTQAWVRDFHLRRTTSTHSQLGIPRPIAAVCAEGESQVYPLCEEAEVRRSSCEMFQLLQEAVEPYYQSLSTFQCERLQGGTLLDVIKCWAVVASLARLLLDSPPGQGTDAGKWFLSAGAPQVRRGALIDAVAESLRLTRERASALVDFLTFDVRAKDAQQCEPWTQPMIGVGDDHLLLLFAPLLWGATRRNVNIWLRQMGADLAQRGHAFERYVREMLGVAAHRSPIGASVKVLGHALKFNLPATAELRYEDIDLLMLIGETLVVAEVKCFLQPAEPAETHHHRNKVIEASKQLERKVRTIAAHDKSFRKQCLKRNFKLPETFHVQPLLILNGPAHCGLPLGRIPVVDMNIMLAFFQGSIRQNIVSSVAEGVLSAQLLHLFDNVQQAQARLSDYLMNPPQLAAYRDAVVRRRSTIPDVIEGLGEVHFDFYEVDHAPG